MANDDAKPHLRIDSHVVIQLGAELISDSEQALLELIKNAYDGDATTCVISIEPYWNPEVNHPWHDHLEGFKSTAPKRDHVGRIVVRDNGLGLSPEAVRNGWLFISASLKRNNSGAKIPTKKNRIPVGDKGLGRLATMRLGDVLYLRTMIEGEESARAVSFAWSAFNSGAPLDQIDVRVSDHQTLPGRKHGTNVEILGLAEPQYWERSGNINSVISKLSSLISPFNAFKDFQVNLKVGEQEHDLQSLSSEALNFASSKFVFSWDGKKLILKTYVGKSLFRGASGAESRRSFDELLASDKLSLVNAFLGGHSRTKNRGFKDLSGVPGGWMFSLEEQLNWHDVAKDPAFSNALDPGPFDGEIYNFLFNDHTKEQLRAANVNLGLVQGMTTIGMYRDRFRVRMNDDWLELSKGVTSGGFFQLRPRNVIGYFSISNEKNPKLVEKSDREGFVDNEQWRGFMALAFRVRKFANDSLDAVRTAFDEYKKKTESGSASRQETGREASARFSLQKDVTKASLSSLISKNDAVSARIEGARKKISELNDEQGGEIISSIAEDLHQAEKQLLAVKGAVANVELATREGFSAASNVALAHEQLEEQNLRLIDAAAVGLSARALTHEIDDHMTRLSRALSVIKRANNAYSDKKIENGVTAIAGIVRELKKSIATIDPLLVGSRSLKDVFLCDFAVNSFFSARKTRLDDLGFEVSVKESGSVKISFSKVRFSQILENFLQNSIFWVNQNVSANLSVKKSIFIDVDDQGFTWWDGGLGVREALEDAIFEPYVTDKPESKGQGLGLFIVTSYLHAEKCSVYLMPERNSFGRRYKFRVDLAGAMRK